MSTTTEEKPDEVKPSPKKQEKGKAKKDKLDPARFHGDGVLFKAKLIGTEDVAEARGDKICQDAMVKLKAAVKSQGHKQRLNIYVSLEGMKIFDEKSSKIIYHHPVHRVSFISRDVGDNRAFGYVCGDGEGHHKFFGIKTEKAAEHLVLTLRDLFQVVFELKRKEVELAKKSKENNNEPETRENKEEPVYEVPGSPRQIAIVGAKDDPESHIYEVPTSNAAVDVAKPNQGTGTLLDLETELATISQGIAQMDAFSDPFTTFDSPPSANASAHVNGNQSGAWSSPQPQAQGGITLAAHAQAPGTPAAHAQALGTLTVDAWGSPPPQATMTMASPFGAQANSDPFVVPSHPGAIPVLPTPPRPVANITSQQVNVQSTPTPATTFNAFSTTNTTVNASFGQLSTPKAQADPFQTDPFFSSTPAPKQSEGDKYAVFQDMSLNATTTSSVNFNESTMFGSNVTDNTMNNAFATSGSIFDGPTLLQPAVVQPVEPEPPNTKTSLFDDLNPITGTNPTKPPKEMFAEKMVVQKKTLNEMKVEQRVMTPDFDTQRQQSPNPFGGGGLDISVGLSNDPFQVNTDPFAVQLAQNRRTSSDTASPLTSDPFSSPACARTSSSCSDAQNSSNPFEPDSSSSRNQTNTPTFTTDVSPPSCPPPTLSKSGLFPHISDDFDLPSPDAPPPPLPAEVQIEYPDVAPAPPPRPRPKSNQSQLTTKTTDLPKLSPPLPRPRKTPQKTEAKIDSTLHEDTDSSDKGTKTLDSVADTTDPFASDPFFTSPVPPQVPKPSDDPFAKFDAKFPGDSVSSSSDSSDPFNMPFDFNTKGASVRNS